MKFRAQGAFEYILLLAGILLVVILAIVILRGGVLSAANNQITGSLGVFSNLTNASQVLEGLATPTPTPAPTVALNLPPDGNSTLEGAIAFVFTPTSALNLSNATLYGNFTGSWLANETNQSTLANGSTNTITLPLSPGNYSWNVEVCDITGQCSFASANYTLEITLTPTPPNVSLIMPVNSTVRSVTTTFQFSPDDSDGFSSASLYTNASGWGPLSTNQSDVVNFSANGITATLPFGEYIWNVRVCDNATNACAFAPENFSVRIMDDWPLFGHDLNNTRASLSPGPASNNTRWTFNETGWSFNSRGISVSDGIVYARATRLTTDKIMALYEHNGTKKWETATFEYFSTTQPVVAGDAIFTLTRNSSAVYLRLYAFYASNGSQIWNFTKTAASNLTIPTVFNGRVYVGLENKLFALNATTGLEIWNRTVPFGNFYSLNNQAPTVSGGIVYLGAGSTAEYIFAYNAETGDYIRNYTHSDGIFGNGGLYSPAVADGIGYTNAAGNGSIYAFNLTDGTKLWSYLVSSKGINSPPLLTNGIVSGSDATYPPVATQKMHMAYAVNGSQAWNFTLGAFLVAAAGGGDFVYFKGTTNRTLYAAYAANGTIAWTFDTGYTNGGWPVVAYGRVYIGTNGGNLSSIGPN